MSLTVPLSLESLMRESAIDAELGALASLLAEARVPIIVAGEADAATRARVLAAFLKALPTETRRIELSGPTEDFTWLPEAESLAVWGGRTVLVPHVPGRSTTRMISEVLTRGR